MKRLLAVLVLVLILGGQCLAADSLWEPWLPKSAERVQIWVQRSQSRYSFFKERLAWQYNVPNLCLDDVVGEAVIVRGIGELTGYGLYFNDEGGNGQFWSASPTRFAPPKERPDLGEMPKGETYQIPNRICSINLHQDTFSRACLELRKLGVKLMIPENELPTEETKRTIRLNNLCRRQVIGQTLALWKMEAWQDGKEYLVLRKPICAGMTEAQAIAGLLATIRRDLARHGLTTIDEASMTDQFLGRLAFAIDKLPPPEDEANPSWRLTDLPPEYQREWVYLSIKGKILRQANGLGAIIRTLNNE